MATHGKQQQPTTSTITRELHPSIFRTNKNVGKVGKGDMVYKHNGNNNDDKYNK